MTIEKDAEEIIDKFSKTLENIPDLEETWYITDNLNLTRVMNPMRKILKKF